jgi:Xaa-Pro aminopeptidase
VIDMGLVLDGYCSDMTRTVVLGETDPSTRKIFRLVRKAQKAGIKAIRAGVTGLEVDRAARQVIEEAGYGEHFGHGLGHGVGLAVHEGPSLSSRYKKKLQAGMVVTVEPGIYLPGWGGVRLENMVVVTADGCEVLNTDTTFLDL